VDLSDIRRVSRSVYGNSYLLEIAAAVFDVGRPSTTQKELAAATRIERNLVFQVVRRLEDAGLITRADAEGNTRPLVATPSVFWQLAASHLDELRGATDLLPRP
jgi:transcription initiation factor IIE alpha subunit